MIRMPKKDPIIGQNIPRPYVKFLNVQLHTIQAPLTMLHRTSVNLRVSVNYRFYIDQIKLETSPATVVQLQHLAKHDKATFNDPLPRNRTRRFY